VTGFAEPRLTFAVVGAGAIGSVLGGRLAAAGRTVLLVGRGAHLETMRRDGLRIGDERIPVDAVADTIGQAPRDVVFLCTKAHDTGAALDTAAPLIGPDTVVVPALNGLPWWYFAGTDGPHAGTPIRAVDPDGALLARLAPARLLGAVVHLGAEVLAPGVVRQAGDNRLAIGELDGADSPRARAIAAALSEAGVPTRVHPAIRDELWTKLVGNLSTNPLSVITGATLDRLFNDPGLLRIVETMMQETMTVGACHGARFAVDPASRIAIGRRLGAFRTSMLQDFERGRPLELAAIVETVLELADRVGVPMPTTRTVLALARAAGHSAVARRSA
jgi:2-dehydropantoate 2-reductase